MPLPVPAEEYVEDLALLVDGEELVARAGAPGLHVGLDTRVGGEELEHLARLYGLDGLSRLDDGHRTLQALAIEDLRRSLGDRHRHPPVAYMRKLSYRRRLVKGRHA